MNILADIPGDRTVTAHVTPPENGARHVEIGPVVLAEILPNGWIQLDERDHRERRRHLIPPTHRVSFLGIGDPA